ncbi:MAG: Verru/Chthon cassette protein A, partial [Verrucomicrobiota bacterium]
VSSSQICDLHLVPQGETVSGMSTFWSTRAITGDNSRERPYTNLLGRLTTKSNSFTVHFRVQVLKKNPTTQANEWVEGRDNVSSEYRGSTLIERYIDPNNTSLPDFATNTSANIDDFYRFRVIQTRKFAP